MTLKRTVSPWLTLMSVAKPWMVVSPATGTSHSLAGAPACWFSQTMALMPQPLGLRPVIAKERQGCHRDQKSQHVSGTSGHGPLRLASDESRMAGNWPVCRPAARKHTNSQPRVEQKGRHSTVTRARLNPRPARHVGPGWLKCCAAETFVFGRADQWSAGPFRRVPAGSSMWPAVCSGIPHAPYRPDVALHGTRLVQIASRAIRRAVVSEPTAAVDRPG